MIARFLIFFFGLCSLSLGIATVTHAGLGTGTISLLAFLLTKLTGLSMGFFVFLTNVFFFILQILVDHKNVWIKAFRQLPICFIFGMIFDVAMMITSVMVPQTYTHQILMVLLGTTFTGLGVASMVFARLAILPPEGLVLSIMQRWGGSFGHLRMGLDLFLVAITVILSLMSFGTIVGLREGTLITALLSGQLAKVFLKVWGKVFPAHRPID